MIPSKMTTTAPNTNNNTRLARWELRCDPGGMAIVCPVGAGHGGLPAGGWPCPVHAAWGGGGAPWVGCVGRAWRTGANVVPKKVP